MRHPFPFSVKDAPRSGRSAPGQHEPDRSMRKNGTISPFTLARPLAGLSISPVRRAFRIPEKWRARCFSAMACLLRRWAERLSQSSIPTMPGDKFAKGTKNSHDRAWRSIVLLKPYTSPPRLPLVDFLVNWGAFWGRWHGPCRAVGSKPIKAPGRHFPSDVWPPEVASGQPAGAIVL